MDSPKPSPSAAPHEHGEIQVASRLVPGPECAGRGVLADRFAGGALKGEFPVVDNAGPLGGQVGGQAGLDQTVQKRPAAVLDQVSP